MRIGAWGLGLFVLTLGLGTGLPAPQLRAQTAENGAPDATLSLRSPVLVLDFERLFEQSAFGQRVQGDIDAESRALIEENNRIEAELTEEERALTEQREILSPEAFRNLADAFDAKVQRLRMAQQVKAESVGQGREREEARFQQLVNPIIGRVMQEAGAVVVLDRRDSLLFVDAIDITTPVLSLANRLIGTGVAPAQPEAASAEPTAPAE